jgi:glycosyltransferase involved in cell wall biosynthesis
MSEYPQLPPISSAPISVILPARNDAAHAADVLTRWFTQLDSLQREYEVLLIDDGSSDGTADAARTLNHPRVGVLRHPDPRGFGAALRTGLAAAQFPLLVVAPADLQYDPAQLPQLLKEIDQNHLVSGFRVWQRVPWPLRFLGGVLRVFIRLLLDYTPDPLPGWLGWRSHAHRCLARVFFGLRMRDVDSRFLLFRRSVFERIPIQSDSAAALLEVLAKANFLGCMMTEVPVAHRPRPAEPEQAGLRQPGADLRRVFFAPEFRPKPGEAGSGAP